VIKSVNKEQSKSTSLKVLETVMSHLKAASPTNGNFLSRTAVWRKTNTFKTLAVYLKNDFKHWEKFSFLFQLKYRQNPRRCLRDGKTLKMPS